MGHREASDNADVAMLVDWENLKFSLAQRDRKPSVTALRQAAEEFGRVVYARAYADWEDEEHAGDPSKLYIAGLEPVYVMTKRYRSATGETRIKNSVDVKLAADCIEASHQFPDVSTYIIVSGDNDFLHIVNTLRPRGKRVVIIGVSWTTAAHLTEQADVVLYYDLDIESFGTQARQRDAEEGELEVKKLEPAVAAATDDALSMAKQPDVSDLDRRKVAEAMDMILKITREYREAGRDFSVSLLGQELQKRMRTSDFQQVGKGKALTYARALEKAGKLKIVMHDFVEHLFLPHESTEMLETSPPPAPKTSYDYAGFVYYDLGADERDRVIQAIQEERNKPGNDWLTFKRILESVKRVVTRDDTSLKNLVNSMVSMGVILKERERTGVDPETKKQFSYPTFALDYQHPDVRRALKLG
ncbi:MAG: NYN domain-containing protein [Dehalococcoidia bacterium]|nr:NYN domain-containing protein [Dehalococcoidia bacterium]